MDINSISYCVNSALNLLLLDLGPWENYNFSVILFPSCVKRDENGTNYRELSWKLNEMTDIKLQVEHTHFTMSQTAVKIHHTEAQTGKHKVSSRKGPYPKFCQLEGQRLICD